MQAAARKFRRRFPFKGRRLCAIIEFTIFAYRQLPAPFVLARASDAYATMAADGHRVASRSIAAFAYAVIDTFSYCCQHYRD